MRLEGRSGREEERVFVSAEPVLRAFDEQCQRKQYPFINK